MKWFKHDTDASTDAKVKKLIIRYGAEGYAVYFHCLELIAGDMTENNITFQLEHDAEIIADNLKIKGTPGRSSIDIVNDIMKYIVELNLFSQAEDKIFCFKMLKRLDSSMTSSPKFRTLIGKAKASHDAVMINHDSVMQDKIRIDKNRTDEKRIEKDKKRVEDLREEYNIKKDKFDIWYNLYDKKVSKDKSLKLWLKLNSDEHKNCLLVVNNYILSTPVKQYRKNPDTYLRNRCWEDEITKPPGEEKPVSKYKEIPDIC